VAICPVIAATDGGCVLDRHWLERITAPLQQAQPADVAYGRTKARGVTLVGRVFAAFYNSKTHVDEAGGSEVSSRTVAFTKVAWQKAGGYPEWLSLAGEDTLFFLELDTFADSAQCPTATVQWYHGAENLAKVYNVHRRNSIGEGEANLWPLRNFALGAIYISLTVGILGGLLFAPIISVISGLLLIGFWSRQSLAVYREWKQPIIMLMLPVVLSTRDAGMLVGYCIGQKRRLLP
jgi:hypothetical protein